MALSLVLESAEIDRPSPAPIIEEISRTRKSQQKLLCSPQTKVDDGQHGAALEDAQPEQHGQLGKDIGEELERDHALALVDGPLAHNVAGGVVAAEPDGGHHHEEMDDGQLLLDFVEVVGAQAGS